MAANQPASETPRACPRCGHATVAPGGHDPWCPACEWNLDAEPSRPYDRGWLFRPFERLAHRAGFRADESVATAPPDEIIGAGRSPGHRLLVLVSALVSAVAVALLGLGVWLTAAHGPKGVLMGLVPIGVAAVMRPRLGRLAPLARRAFRLTPAQAPALHALIDRVAAVTGGPRPDVVLLTRRPEITSAVVGMRRTRVLLLGLPILLALAPQERVALIGHALAHSAPARIRTRVATQVGRAFFRGIGRALRPMPMPRDMPAHLRPLGWLVWQFVGAVAWAPAWGLHLIMCSLDARGQRRWELRADLAGMRASGTVGMLGALNELALWPYYARMVNGTAPAGQALAVWRRRIEHVRGTRPADLTQLRQLGTRLDASVLSGHLPLGRRYQFLAEMPYEPPRVLVSTAQAARIDAELAPYAELLRDRLAEAFELGLSTPGGYAPETAGATIPTMRSMAPWWSLLGPNGRSVRAGRL